MKNFLVATLTGLAAVVSSTQARADLKIDYMMKHLLRRAPMGIAETTKAGVFQQQLNHDNPRDPRKFAQRYFYNTTYATTSDSPVIFYICGESTCDGSELTSGETMLLARTLKATVIELEHRYYGQSQPFPVLSPANLVYLKSQFALQDLDAFQHWAMQNLNLNGKWIAVGGSYPGALSAWYRALYPQNVIGALASSAPVHAKADFEEYDRHVAEIAGPACAAQARAVVAKVEAAMHASSQARAAVQQQFGGGDIQDPVDFLYVVADMGAFAVQYGYVNQFCQALNSNDPVAGYANVGMNLFRSAGLTPYADSFQAAQNADASQNQELQMRQWMYQSCTEFGFYQIAYHDPNLSARSAAIDLAYHQSVCQRLFGLTKPVDTSATNARYYAPILNSQTSHIFFTNGSQDPWMTLSITQANGNAENPNLDLMTIQNASHCSDLAGSGGAAGQAAQWQFIKLATQWLQ